MNQPLTESKSFGEDIFSAHPGNFELLALKLFRFQYEQNDVYRQFCDALNRTTSSVEKLTQIPFLPVQFFKSHSIKSTSFEPDTIFESSGTTGSVNSRHFVKDTALYEKSFSKAFEIFYGNVNRYCILGLLPSYLERKNASLVWMVDTLIKKSGHPSSGFFLNDFKTLAARLRENEAAGQPTLLLGVTYALLDFFELNPLQLCHTVIMETGGMKGRREEMQRADLHRILKSVTGLPAIHSEYGMTEMLSQAYSKKDGIFECPPWMNILLRQEDDPFELCTANCIKGNITRGAVNIIDLANMYSCSFIATDDIGGLYKDGRFEITGRMDNSDIRGCSQMYIPME